MGHMVNNLLELVEQHAEWSEPKMITMSGASFIKLIWDEDIEKHLLVDKWTIFLVTPQGNMEIVIDTLAASNQIYVSEYRLGQG